MHGDDGAPPLWALSLMNSTEWLPLIGFIPDLRVSALALPALVRESVVYTLPTSWIPGAPLAVALNLWNAVRGGQGVEPVTSAVASAGTQRSAHCRERNGA